MPSRKRVQTALEPDAGADERIKLFFARMIRPRQALARLTATIQPSRLTSSIRDGWGNSPPRSRMVSIHTSTSATSIQGLFPCDKRAWKRVAFGLPLFIPM
jgi:hypothetical protein